MMEQRVGERSADKLVEQDEHESGFLTPLSVSRAVAASDAFEQTMGFILRRRSGVV
jgi:hypothetical protein